MSDTNKFSALVDDIWEMVFGTKRRSETKRNGDRRSEDRGTPDRREKPKRARGPKGRYKGDDKSTPDVNEAYVDGKKPKSKAKAKAPAKKRGRGRPKGSKNKK